ncbi:ATP-binding cassette domain-containing protein [Bifidobacterium aquikefiricola]|uniref:ATP-binding cassette domain-containing protein n=1 Tax=Bifidobacterium aquikefiricola TaxID=3059038 RepID=A0AB39U4H9_9BIFI
MKQLSVFSLHHISFQYPDSSEYLFSDISVTFPLGWTALIGDNGMGKTTLMHIATGQLKPSEGTVIPHPGQFISGYCQQTTDRAPANLDDFANDWSAETMNVRRALEIGDDWPWRYDTLSGGERKRLQLACALALRPELLILDEPSNHVDARTRSAIVAAMQTYRGVGILISHDIDLIDATVQQCVVLQRQHVNGKNQTMAITRPGNYSQVHEQIAGETATAESNLAQTRHELHRLNQVKAQRSQAVQHVEALKDGSRINRKDHDARAKHKLAKMSGMDLKASQASGRLNNRLKRAENAQSQIVTAAKRYDGDIWFHTEPSHRKELLHMQKGFIPFEASVPVAPLQGTSSPSDAAKAGAFGDDSTARDASMSSIPGLWIPTLSVGPLDHIGIVGDNGTGKTTLFHRMKAMLEISDTSDTDLGFPSPEASPHRSSSHEAVRALVIEQEQTQDQIESLFNAVEQLNHEEYSQLCSSLAQLNADPERILDNRAPSAGEFRKLQLCLGALRHPHLIMMDEPTNHLDLHSVESLTRVLQAFTGAIIVISHNDHFLSHITSIRWRIERKSRIYTTLSIA